MLTVCRMLLNVSGRRGAHLERSAWQCWTLTWGRFPRPGQLSGGRSFQLNPPPSFPSWEVLPGCSSSVAMPRGLPRSEETIALRNANLQGGTIDEQSQELTPEPKSRESWRRLHFGPLIFPSTISAVDEIPRPLQRSPRQ